MLVARTIGPTYVGSHKTRRWRKARLMPEQGGFSLPYCGGDISIMLKALLSRLVVVQMPVALHFLLPGKKGNRKGEAPRSRPK